MCRFTFRHHALCPVGTAVEWNSLAADAYFFVENIYGNNIIFVKGPHSHYMIESPLTHRYPTCLIGGYRIAAALATAKRSDRTCQTELHTTQRRCVLLDQRCRVLEMRRVPLNKTHLY